jgi:hypothetical protein
MQHDLIGFLIDALESSERESIEAQLRTDENLRQELEAARISLSRLNWDAEPFRAPAGLAERTCEFVQRVAEVDVGRPLSDLTGVSSPMGLSGSIPRPSGWSKPETRDSAHPASVDFSDAETGGWTFADFVVAAGICVAAACLFFPAILNSRYNSQLTFCQNNLRQLGKAFQTFSDQNGGYFPTVPATGKLAFAGIYAAKLRDHGLIDESNSHILTCPSRGGTVVIRIARSEDVNRSQGATLVRLQKTIGGDYAYSLGFVEDGKLRGIRRSVNRNQQRAQYAILADAPLGIANREFRGVHDGQNVLFEDGRAAFVATRKRPGAWKDDFFVNDNGYVEAGVHSEDCVLASSPTPPLVFVRE